MKILKIIKDLFIDMADDNTTYHLFKQRLFEYIDSFEYWFIKPFQHRHKHYKIGEMRWFEFKNYQYGDQFAIILEGPLDRFDGRWYWKKRKRIKKCLYRIYLIESQVELIIHFKFLKDKV